MQHKVTFIKKDNQHNYYFSHHGQEVVVDESKVMRELKPGDNCLLEIAFGRVKEIY